MLFYSNWCGVNNMAATHPFKVSIEMPIGETPTIKFLEVIVEIKKWLKENIDEDNYLTFSGVGDWTHCFFNNEEDAILFKLTWSQ